MLIESTKWAHETFEKGSRPNKKTVADWILSGEVPGRIIGDNVYVDAEQFALRNKAEPPRTGLELLA